MDEKNRLDRIELKIDKLGEALIELARADERISTIEDYIKNQGSACAFHESRIRSLEEASIRNCQTIDGMRKMGTVLVSAVIAQIVVMVFG